MQVTTVKDVRGFSALFLYRKIAAAPAHETVFMAGPPMDTSEATMSVRPLHPSVRLIFSVGIHSVSN